MCIVIGMVHAIGWSDLNRNHYLLYTLWNINCDVSSSTSCKNFVLNFNNTQSCIYYASTNTTCVEFPTTEPTLNPTSNPTPNRTQPTIEPAVGPTTKPTASPTILPTSTNVASRGPRMGSLRTTEAGAGGDQFLGLETGAQYMLFILLITACTVCFVVLMKN